MLETCGRDVAGILEAAGAPGLLRPHVVIVTGKCAHTASDTFYVSEIETMAMLA